MRIPLKELFSTPDEVHSFIIGISHGFFFFQKHWLVTKYLEKEMHYYGMGKILGFVLFGVFMACLWRVLIGW